MGKEEFIRKLREAGWKSTGDAQYQNITNLWKRLFPTIANLEEELESLKEDISRNSHTGG